MKTRRPRFGHLMLGADDSQALASLLCIYRRTAALRQIDASDRSGINEKLISAYERGDRSISFATLLALLNAYGVGLEQFARQFSREREFSSLLAVSPRRRDSAG